MADKYYSGAQWSSPADFILATPGFGWHVEACVQVLRLMVAGVFEELPNLKVISGHWGEMLPGYLGRFDDQLGPVTKHLDRSISETYRERVYVTPSGIMTPAQLRLCVDMVGADHILWSEDVPYILRDDIRTFLESADKEAIAHGNAERLLGLVSA